MMELHKIQKSRPIHTHSCDFWPDVLSLNTCQDDMYACCHGTVDLVSLIYKEKHFVTFDIFQEQMFFFWDLKKMMLLFHDG